MMFDSLIGLLGISIISLQFSNITFHLAPSIVDGVSISAPGPLPAAHEKAGVFIVSDKVFCVIVNQPLKILKRAISLLNNKTN